MMKTIFPKQLVQIFQYLCFTLSFLIPAILVTNYTLNNFYVSGPHGYDTGWFAYLSTHAIHWPLPNPALFGGTFFSTHMSFIFYLFSTLYHSLSWLGLSFPPPLFFSIEQGMWFGLLSLSAYCLFLPVREKRHALHIGLAFIFSLLTLVNGVSIAIMIFPHIETGIPTLLIAFLALWIHRFHKLCYVPLIIGLMIREDAGLHFAWAFTLLAITFYFILKTKSAKVTARYFLNLAVLCFLYSALIIILQKIYFPSNMLAKIYLGTPPLHHVTWSFIKNRFFLIILGNVYIYVPLIFSAILAYRHRDIIQALGVFFVIPWVTFSFFAITVGAGTLTTYYAFPILVALLWPAITYGLRQKFALVTRPYISYWKDASLILGSSLLSGIALLTVGYFLFLMTLPPDFLQKNVSNTVDFRWTQYWKSNQNALDAVFASHHLGQNFIVDSAVATLEIDKISPKNFYIKDNLPTLPPDNAIKKIDLMLFLPDSTSDSDNTEKIIALAHLTVTCPLSGSSYRLAKKPGTHSEVCE